MQYFTCETATKIRVRAKSARNPETPDERETERWSGLYIYIYIDGCSGRNAFEL